MLRACPYRYAYHVGNQIRAMERSSKHKSAKTSGPNHIDPGGVVKL
ncbi:MAG TPA: hypothetical protein VGG64_18005 [Pirellulales bacterium]|jgi:hypothetical protein